MWGGRHEHGGCRKHPHYSEIGLGAFREFGSILREYNNEIKVTELVQGARVQILEVSFSNLFCVCFVWKCHFSSTNPSSPRDEQNSPFLACHVANNSNILFYYY